MRCSARSTSRRGTVRRYVRSGSDAYARHTFETRCISRPLHCEQSASAYRAVLASLEQIDTPGALWNFIPGIGATMSDGLDRDMVFTRAADELGEERNVGPRQPFGVKRSDLLSMTSPEEHGTPWKPAADSRMAILSAFGPRPPVSRAHRRRFAGSGRC